MLKQELLKNLYVEYSKQFHGKEIVLGSGNIECKLLLIGEAPGKDEVRIGKPFVGTAGKNLSEFLDIIKLKREEIYITNAIKYRLSEVSKTGRLVNRPAKKEEISENREYLLKEISIINPEYIVSLGNVPLKSVTGDYNASIGSVHGALLTVMIFNKEYGLIPLYHPASVIYNQSLRAVYKSDIENMRNMISV